MNNKGFTLIELLTVMVIMGLLIAIAIPATAKIMNASKEKGYKTKIEFIEQEAILYGETNIEKVKQGIDFTSGNKYKCDIQGDDIVSVQYVPSNASGTNALDGSETAYPCIRFTVDELAKNNYLNYDVEDFCNNNSNCNNDNRQHFNNQITNLVTNNIINYCHIYVYYKNNRVYAYFDKTNCNHVQIDPYQASLDGNEYKSIIWSK